MLFLVFYIALIVTESTFGQSNNDVANIVVGENKVLVSETDKNYEKYLTLIEKNQLAQKELIASTNYFKNLRNKKYVLSGKDISIINQTFTKRINLLNQSITFPKNALKFIKNLHFYNLIATHLKIKAFQTYMVQQNVVGQNAKVINLVNEENKLYRQKKKSLKRIGRFIISKKFRKSILKDWNNAVKIDENNLNKDKNAAILTHIVETSFYQNFLSNPEKIKKSRKYFRKLINRRSSFNTKVGFNKLTNSILSELSNLIGNFIGILATRKGKLYNNKIFIKTSLNLLQPLDVILEKTPFRLTDKFIPGYWGHVAICVGNETQLKKLGVWNNPFVIKYHKEIKEGKSIIEALRSKVKLNSFINFANIDDYAHLRLIKEPSLEKKRKMIIKVFAQIGKRYDFRYDVESSKKLMCAELIYITFDEVAFNTFKYLGINSMSVDKVAEQGLKGGAFYPVDLYLDGVRIKRDSIFEIYNQLLTLKNKEIRRLKKSIH